MKKKKIARTVQFEPETVKIVHKLSEKDKREFSSEINFIIQQYYLLVMEEGEC